MSSRDARLVHTADLEPALLHAARSLVEQAFADDFSEPDWEHCLGGLHALLVEDGELVGHAAVGQRRLLHAGQALRAGYVEGVAVRADRRRRGHGDALMAAVEGVVHRAYDLGALSATDDGRPLYERRGWRRWRGPTSVLAPDGPRATPDDEVHVLPAAVPLDLVAPLAADWREGDVW